MYAMRKLDALLSAAATIQPTLSPFTPDGDFVDNDNIENTTTKAYLTTYKAEHCT